MTKTVIVGGVAGGATAAARLRRLDEKAEIIVFEKSGLRDMPERDILSYLQRSCKK